MADKKLKYLQSLDKSQLISIILQQSNEDAFLENSLQNSAEAMAPALDTVSSLKKQINKAFIPGFFVAGYNISKYSRQVDSALALLRGAVTSLNPAAAMELCEFAIKTADKGFGNVDDSSGMVIADTMQELEDLYYAVCLKAKPDAVLLARRLFRMHTECSQDIFYNAAKKFVSLLGKEGLRELKSLAITQWDKVKDDKNERGFGSGAKYRAIFEDLAILSGDTEELVKSKSMVLDYPYTYLEIARIYKGAGNNEKALEWAENGMKNFPNFRDGRVAEFLAEIYAGRGRVKEAQKLMWDNFAAVPDIETYSGLKEYAEMTNEWDIYREKAMGFIRAKISAEKTQVDYSGRKINRWQDVLVVLLLWEKKNDEAWQEALQGGCSANIWDKLAEVRLKAYPLDTVFAYKKIVDDILVKADKSAYRKAAGYIKDIVGILNDSKKTDEILKCIAEIRIKHKAKRNFIKILDKMRLPGNIR